MGEPFFLSAPFLSGGASRRERRRRERSHNGRKSKLIERAKKKNRNHKKKPKPQTGGLAHRRLLLAPSRGDAHVYLPDGRRGHPAQLQAHGGVRGAHLHADDAGRQGEARVFFLFFVFCLLSSGPEGRERRTKPFALVLVFSLFPSFFLLSLYFPLLRRELQKTREEREASERERSSPPLRRARGLRRAVLLLFPLPHPLSLPPSSTTTTKNSLHRRPTSSSTGSPPAASSASSTPRPSASAAPTTRTRRRTSSSRSPRGTTPSGSS